MVRIEHVTVGRLGGDGAPSEAGIDWTRLHAEFPEISSFVPADCGRPDAPRPHEVHVLLDAWSDDDLEVARCDAAVDARTEPFSLHLWYGREDGAARAAVQVLTRYQYRLDRRNTFSQGPTFDRALRCHETMHDLRKPLVAADYVHARDTWQWTLRLDPRAGMAVQLAALFHDAERLESEADHRIEHHAADYQAFKEAHARSGALLVARRLGGIGLAPTIVGHVTMLVADHERPGEDEETLLLADADALSFFSRNASGFLDYYGEEHTRLKLEYSLRRLRRREWKRIREIRLRTDVARLLHAVLQTMLAKGGASLLLQRTSR